jgi:hypothetical protein
VGITAGEPSSPTTAKCPMRAVARRASS